VPQQELPQTVSPSVPGSEANTSGSAGTEAEPVEEERTGDADTVTKRVANGAMEPPQFEQPASASTLGAEHGATVSSNTSVPETEQPVSGSASCAEHATTTFPLSFSNPPPSPSRPNGEDVGGDVREDMRFPLSNPQPILSRTNLDDSTLLLPTTLHELRAMESLVKEKKKAIRSLKKLAADPNDKQAATKQLEAQLKAMKTELKKEKEQAKKSKPVRPSTKRPRCDTGSDDEDGD
jgi:hypothetical protein